jgi:PAS domain S-box-containing protein
MSDAKAPSNSSSAADLRSPAYIGPLIPPELWPLRYIAAVVVVFATVGIRMGLAPLLGTQAPLLPFVLAVFVSAYLGGRGPGLLASVLTPIAATVWFTTWPHDAPAQQWGAHVLFFLLIAALTTAVMHELQRSSLSQLIALRDAARSEAETRKTVEQLTLVTDAMPALISYIAPNGTYRFVNKLYERWFGQPTESMVGRHVADVLGPDAYEAVRPRLERALQGTRVFFEDKVPYPGNAREVSVHYIPDFDAAGQVRGCFALIEDVSARKRTERALREADRRKDDFLAILGHELRNPLAPIRTVAHVLGRGPVDAETVRRSSELLERQSKHLTRMVDDLVDVARIMRGRVSLHREPVMVETVVNAAIESVRSLFEARRQSVAMTSEGEGLFVQADSARLCQVIANLLINAIKYSPEGARTLITVEAAWGEVVIRVRDQGAGIDPQMLPHIFDRFLQGEDALDRSQGGLGIGLTIAKHLVEMHGGRVEAGSEGLGSGSEFRVYLPQLDPPQVQPNEQPRAASAPAKRRVLVVEDNRDAAEALSQLLVMSGHEVEVVNDGASALEKLEEFPADVVLLDIGLPRMDGYMVAHAIRARFANLDTRPRLLALTGYARDEDRASALRSGFDGHLIKPVEPEELLRVIMDDGQRQFTPKELG